jgi:hypothetical protein
MRSKYGQRHERPHVAGKHGHDLDMTVGRSPVRRTVQRTRSRTLLPVDELSSEKKRNGTRVKSPQPLIKRLSKNKPSLGHRPLRSIHNATPSTILKVLSTSPPKYACPGVSTTLINTFGQDRYTTFVFEVIGVHKTGDEPVVYMAVGRGCVG